MNTYTPNVRQMLLISDLQLTSRCGEQRMSNGSGRTLLTRVCRVGTSHATSTYASKVSDQMDLMQDQHDRLTDS